MSEIYPSVREHIRARILQELYRAEEPLSTQQLLARIDEAETSSTLAMLCAGLYRTGKLGHGPKVMGANGLPANTWTLAPATRQTMTTTLTARARAKNPMSPMKAKTKTKPAPAAAPPPAPGTDPLPLPITSYEDERPSLPCAHHHAASQELDDALTQANLRQQLEALTAERDQLQAQLAEAGTNWPALRGRCDRLSKERDQLQAQLAEQEATWAALRGEGGRISAERDQALAQLDNALRALTQADAERFHLRQELDRAQYIVEKQRRLPTLPSCWFGRLRLWLTTDSDQDDELRIDIDDEGGGAYASVKARLTCDPGELAWLPRLTDGLIELHQALLPGENRPSSLVTTSPGMARVGDTSLEPAPSLADARATIDASGAGMDAPVAIYPRAQQQIDDGLSLPAG